MVILEHQQIVDAVEAGNSIAAETELREHIAGVLISLDALETLHPDYFDPVDTFPATT